MQNQNIKVSILVPIYGVEKYIAQCAISLFEQDYPNIEYIFVNDCTTDKSLLVLNQVINKYSARREQVSIINHDVNMGLAAARNTALDHSTGDYILHIDSDDFFSSKTVISELINRVNQEDSDAVFFDFQEFPKYRVHTIVEFPFDSLDLTKRILERTAPMSICGCLYKKELFIQNNIRSIPNISLGEDYAIKPRITYYMKSISYINKPFYCYRQENNQSMTRQFKNSYVYDLVNCIDGFDDFFKDKPLYEDFKKSIEIGAMRCKISLVIALLNSESNSHEKFVLINRAFKGKCAPLSFENLKSFFIYRLIQFRMVGVLKVLLKVKRYFS